LAALDIWSPMRFLVTGADGFIGSHVVEALLAARPEWDVVAFVHRAATRWLQPDPAGRLAIVVGDASRSLDLERVGDVDAIINLVGMPNAALCDQDPEAARLANFQSAVNALNLSAQQGQPARVVIVSTAALYGEVDYLPITEDHPVEPKGQYTNTKLAAELTAAAYARDSGVPSVIVRPFNIYGPRQADDFVVPTIVKQCLMGIELRLGDGRPVRNFTYVTDAADLLVRAAIAKGVGGNTINLGSRPVISIEQLARKVVEMTGCGLEPVFDRGRFREADPTVHEMDPSLAERLLGWRPLVPLEVGLARTIEHYRARLAEERKEAARRMYGGA